MDTVGFDFAGAERLYEEIIYAQIQACKAAGVDCSKLERCLELGRQAKAAVNAAVFECDRMNTAFAVDDMVEALGISTEK